jgi:alpha-1,3-glucan synthase
MSSSLAWQLHGCYALDSDQYVDMPWDAARRGCHDDAVSLDHRDPSHPVRNIIKHMYHLREKYAVLNDGWYLQSLSNQTHIVQHHDSGNSTTETGIWSVLRSEFKGAQDLSSAAVRGNQSVWLVYHNDNKTVTYNFDCSSSKKGLIAAFGEGTRVKNLFFPHEEITLGTSPSSTGLTTPGHNGCIEELTMKAYEFKAYVPKDKFVGPPPMITRFLPGHDARVLSNEAAGKQDSIEFEIGFSAKMNCDRLTASIKINSTTEDRRRPTIQSDSVQCSSLSTSDQPSFVAGFPTIWTWKAKLVHVSNGVHSITVFNATGADNATFTNSVDRFIIRVGRQDNPVVFPKTANYTKALLHGSTQSGELWVSQKAAGADKWRYTLDWGKTWSSWLDYQGGNYTLPKQPWNTNDKNRAENLHIITQYWNRLAGSSSTIQHADLERQNDPPKRFPSLFAHGPKNQYGHDAGLRSSFDLHSDGDWRYHFLSEWPDYFQLNVWGNDANGREDHSVVFGDIDGDSTLDRLPPSSLAKLSINITTAPPSPFLAYLFKVNDGTYRYELIPVGNRWLQLVLFLLMAWIPLSTAIFSVWVYMHGFYDVKFNKIGVSQKGGVLQRALRIQRTNYDPIDKEKDISPSLVVPPSPLIELPNDVGLSELSTRRTVLIATMEYDIDDWDIKIKIGGLGVMAQLMGKNLGHQGLLLTLPQVFLSRD